MTRTPPGGSETPVIEGVIIGDVAEAVWHENGVLRIRLTCMPGHPALTAARYPGGKVTVELPEPVDVQPGEIVVVEIAGMPGEPLESEPFRVESAMTMRSATGITPGR